MNRKIFHSLVDWTAILIMVAFILGCWVNHDMWNKLIGIAPVCIFMALGLLFLNHVSLVECFKSKDTEFFLMAGGIILAGINMILVKSRIGAIFTLADFLLLLYLADKVKLDKWQLGAIAGSCAGVWVYWQFIDKTVYGNTIYNPNGAALLTFTCFCVSMCYFVYLMADFNISKWIYHGVIFILFAVLTRRVLSFNSRGVLAAIAAWLFAYYFLPKRKFTVPVIIGVSLFVPVILVSLWNSGSTEGIVIMNKRLSSGRELIWSEFFKVFIQHPITGIGSNFDQMVPDLYAKEIHHALLDLLFVHGIPVFLITIYFLYKRITEMIKLPYNSVLAVCLASVYGILAAGTFENYFIVSPYNVTFLTILLIMHNFNHTLSEATDTNRRKDS